VTRGLDPNVERKPSGVTWVEDVPAHWSIVALKRVLRRLVDCEHKTAPAVDTSEYRVVRTSAIRHGRIRWSGTYCTTPEAFNLWTQRAVPEPGDVIFTREAPAGEACVVPEDVKVCLGQRTVLMKLRRDKYDPEFLVHMIYAAPPRIRIQLASQGSTVRHFNMDDIGWMHVLAPPLEDHSKNADEVVMFKKTHDLNWLWERIKAEVPAKLGGDTWDGFDTEFIGKLIKDLHKADPGSYGFRYNGETFGVEPKGINDEVVIDFEALRAQMKHVYNVLHSMQVYLIETHGMNAEWQAEMSAASNGEARLSSVYSGLLNRCVPCLVPLLSLPATEVPETLCVNIEGTPLEINSRRAR
jgi:hypothetical protein